MKNQKCQTCQDKKTVSFLPGGKTMVNPGYEKEMQGKLDEFDAGNLEKKPCPDCGKQLKVGIKIVKKIHVKPTRTGKKQLKKKAI